MNTAKKLVSTSRRHEKELKAVKRRFKFTRKAKKTTHKKKQNTKLGVKTTIIKKSISIDSKTDSFSKDFGDLYNKDLESVDSRQGRSIYQ